MKQSKFRFPGVTWVIAWMTGAGVLLGFLLPWYTGTIQGAGVSVFSVERGWGSPEGWIVGIATATGMVTGFARWLLSGRRPGLWVTALALLLAIAAFAAAW